MPRYPAGGARAEGAGYAAGGGGGGSCSPYGVVVAEPPGCPGAYGNSKTKRTAGISG